MEIHTKRSFGYRKAVKYGRVSRHKKAEFWRKVYILYPELEKQNVSYNIETKTFTVIKEKKKIN